MKKNKLLSIIYGIIIGAMLTLVIMLVKPIQDTLKYQLKKWYQKFLVYLRKQTCASQVNNKAREEGQKIIQKINRKAENILREIKQKDK